uniref:Polyphosphoinositide phosphatase (Trinotate prediction) n=1 Tax=Myxobolus squamalis TaxID=59785 RepID=A0A6B2FXD8_MYXSQ
MFNKTGIFHYKNGKPSYQNGIIRVNCMDCLDRTNVAQYLVGLYALGHQLKELDVAPNSNVTDSHIAEILRNLYTAHGDTLAAQNTGSQMAHRIEAYFQGTRVITDHSRDIYQTLTRYYQNTFQGGVQGLN